MKITGYLVYVIIAIGGTLLFIFNSSKTEKAAFKEQYKNYVATAGKITDKRQRIGPRAKVLITYVVSYTDRNGKEYRQTSTNVGNGLGNSYETGDTLTVYYNPLSPYDPVIDRTGLEAGSEISNYNNVIPYAAGTVVLVAALFIYKRRSQTGS